MNEKIRLKNDFLFDFCFLLEYILIIHIHIFCYQSIERLQFQMFESCANLRGKTALLLSHILKSFANDRQNELSQSVFGHTPDFVGMN